MLRRCCCFDLRTGSILVGSARLLHWTILLVAIAHVWSQLLQNVGMFHYKVRTNFEENAYVLALIILVSTAGVVVETLMISSVIKGKNFGYIRAWFWLTGFTVTASLIMALSFLLHNLDVIGIGGNWLENAMCVLADLVFYYIPEFLFGPRMIPVLTAMLIIMHMLLPILHSSSYYVVYSYYRSPLRAQTGHSRQATPSVPLTNGAKGTPEDQVIPYDHHSHNTLNPNRVPLKLCQKCAMRGMGENGGTCGRGGISTPLIGDQIIVETTC